MKPFGVVAMQLSEEVFLQHLNSALEALLYADAKKLLQVRAVETQYGPVGLGAYIRH